MEKMYTWEKTFVDSMVTDPESKKISPNKDAVYQEMKESVINDLRALVRARRDFDVHISPDGDCIKIDLFGIEFDNYITCKIVEIVSEEPDRVKLEQKIREMSDDELVDFINDTIDHDYFPECRLKEIDDEEAWDRIGEYLGGSQFRKCMEASGSDSKAVWFIYTEEGLIEYFDNKDDLLDYFGIEHLVDELACRQ